MECRRYTDVHVFYDDTYDVLMQAEAQNMIPLGNVIIGHEGKNKLGWRDPANWFMATVSDDEAIKLVAIMTPPHNLTLYAIDNVIDEAVIDCLIEGLDGIEVPGVTTEKGLAEYFADVYTKRKNMTHSIAMSQRIYELTRVNPDIPQIGEMRLLNERDMHFLPYWLSAFQASTVYGNTEMHIPKDVEECRFRLSEEKLYVLEDDGVPVSMAGFTRVMETAIGVAFVYTPPYFRGRGYASSCVARLSRIALDKGFKRCVLYTDLANPTSNSIYQKIGYVPVCDSMMLKFEALD